MSQTSAMVSNIGAEFSTIKSLLNKEYQKLENLQHSIQKSSKEICAADLNQNPIEGIDVLQSINLKYHTIRRIKTVAQILLFLSASNSSVQIPHWKSTQKPGMIFWNIFNDMVAQKNSELQEKAKQAFQSLKHIPFDSSDTNNLFQFVVNQLDSESFPLRSLFSFATQKCKCLPFVWNAKVMNSHKYILTLEFASLASCLCVPGQRTSSENFVNYMIVQIVKPVHINSNSVVENLHLRSVTWKCVALLTSEGECWIPDGNYEKLWVYEQNQSTVEGTAEYLLFKRVTN